MRNRTLAWEQAVGAYGIEPQPRPRPSWWRWLLYVVWVPLPEEHRVWVLYDCTCSTWVLRHFARIVVLMAVPTTLLILLLPGPTGTDVLVGLTAGGVAFFFTGVWINEGTEHRLVQAGWPYQFADTVRRLRSSILDGTA